MPNKVKKDFYIERSQAKRLKKEAEKPLVSQAQVVRRALDEYFAKKDKGSLS